MSLSQANEYEEAFIDYMSERKFKDKIVLSDEEYQIRINKAQIKIDDMIAQYKTELAQDAETNKYVCEDLVSDAEKSLLQEDVNYARDLMVYLADEHYFSVELPIWNERLTAVENKIKAAN